MDLHFLEPVTLDMLSRELGVSKFLISRIFSDQLHTSFRDYVNGRRVALAQMLLLSTTNPVTEIAFESGFNSLRSFYRAFKKEYGNTPNEYRRNAEEMILVLFLRALSSTLFLIEQRFVILQRQTAFLRLSR